MTAGKLRLFQGDGFSGKGTIVAACVALAFMLGGCAATSPAAGTAGAARDATPANIEAPDAVARARAAPKRNVSGVFELTVRSVVVRDGIVLLASESDPRKPDLLIVEVMPSAQEEVLARTRQPAARYFRNKHITVQGVARRVVLGTSGKGAAAVTRHGTRIQMDHFAQVLTILE